MTPEQASDSFDSSDEEISLSEIGAALMARKWLIVVCTVLSTLMATALALWTPPTFRAEVLIVPTKETDGKGGLSALTGQFGGLASLAGLNISGGGDKSVAIATLASRALTESYIEQHQLLPILFYKSWDSGKNAFKPDGRGKTPSLWDGNKLFNKGIRSIAEDKKTGLVTLAIEWQDPVLAAQWANDLVKLTNTTLRDRAIADSNRNLAYLNSQVEKTSVAELRQAIYRQMESEIKSIMAAQGSEEYAFKIVDPAVVPQEKSKPKRKLYVLFGFALGLMLSGLAAVMLRANRPANS